jgi:hypothetical protein
MQNLGYYRYVSRPLYVPLIGTFKRKRILFRNGKNLFKTVSFSRNLAKDVSRKGVLLNFPIGLQISEPINYYK